MAPAPPRYSVNASRVLLAIAALLFVVGFLMAVGFVIDKKTAEDILGVDSLGLAFAALAFIV